MNSLRKTVTKNVKIIRTLTAFCEMLFSLYKNGLQQTIVKVHSIEI